MSESEGCISGYWNGFVSNMSAFKTFIYNSEDGTVMGRDGSSWLRISIFYLGYYCFLAALFAISITTTLSVLDEYQPFFQTRLQYPGVSIMPRTNKFDPPSLDIRYSVDDKTTSQAYVDGIDDILAKYPADQSGSEYIDCTANSFDHQTFTDDTTAAACRFQTSEFLSTCIDKSSRYGYDTNSPCIFFKLNKIINWTPVAFMSLNDEQALGGGDSGAVSLSDHLTTTGATYDKQISYVSCGGVKQADKDALATATTDIKYSPAGFESKYYPFLGKKRQPNYLNPLVSIQLNNLPFNKEVRMYCKVYARNMIDLARINVGYVEFKVQVDKK